MAYPYEDKLRKRAQIFIQALQQVDISAKIVVGSFHQYSVKVAVAKSGRSFGKIVIHYSSKKDSFKPGYNELIDQSIISELDECWYGTPSSSSTGKTAGQEQIYIDGSFMDGGIGYSVVILKNGKVIQEFWGPVPTGDNPDVKSTRQVAGELFATQEAIKWCQIRHIKQISIHYDYDGIAKWATGDWQAKQPLTKQYVEFVNNSGLDIQWIKVASHTGDRWNERADQLAKKGATSGKSRLEDNQDPISLITEKATQFVEFLLSREIIAEFDKIYNNLYARILIFEQSQKVGMCDLYNTKKRPLSSPYWHAFSNKAFQNQLEDLWADFFSGIKSPDISQGMGFSDTAFIEIDHYYNILKPYEDCEFDFVDLTRAIQKAVTRISGKKLTLNWDEARYDFKMLESAYKELRKNINV